MATKWVLAREYLYSLVEGYETVLIPGGEYKLPVGDANELILRGLVDELPKIKKPKTSKRPPKINYRDDADDTVSRSEAVPKSRSKRRGRGNKSAGTKRRKSSKKLSKSKPKK